LFQIAPYKQFNKLIQDETLEPVINWGVRMALATTVPVIWGVATNQLSIASWITLTAECLCWIELKGTFAQRMRILLGGTFIAMLFAVLGSVTSNSIWLSVTGMLVVGFLSGLFKNLGTRASGLATCIYVLFIISNAYPTKTTNELEARIFLTGVGGLWNLIIGIAATIFIPAKEPYRRTIAVILKANATLIREVAKGWDEKSLRSSIRDIYLKEKDVRTAIDNSFQDYEKMAYQVHKDDKEDYQLAHLRKAAALMGTHIQAISEELETVRIKDVETEIKYKLNATLKSLGNVMERMSIFLVLLNKEEELLLSSRISRLIKHFTLLREYKLPETHPYYAIFSRVEQLIERMLLVVESAVASIQKLEDDLPVFRSYSLVKTLLILHPKYWLRSIRLLFNPSTFTTRYALRSAIAAAVAIFLFKWLKIDHGYWLAFTVIIVVQPYFGATFKKAIDRVIGTVAGGLVGGLVIRLNAGIYLREFMLFVCFVCMVYFIRKRYAVAAFFITLSVVLLFDVEEQLDSTLIITRALATIAGAALAIIAGFALLPNWDRKWLPIHLTGAIDCNYNYFIQTFFTEKPINWTKHKRSAESKNSNVFDSFNRYMQEPAIRKRAYTAFYQLITHNVRITRELNNIHLEQETSGEKKKATETQQQKINECLEWFNKNILLIKELNPKIKTEPHIPGPDYLSPFCLSIHQSLYMDKMIYEMKALHRDLIDLIRVLNAEL